jgi:hypothetical protein
MSNPNIKHKHEVIDGVIQTAQSDCYPNCKQVYGIDGVGPHAHALSEGQVSKPTEKLKIDKKPTGSSTGGKY